MPSDSCDIKDKFRRLEFVHSATRHALLRRIQEDNSCHPTGFDCNNRGVGRLCACSVKMQDEMGQAVSYARNYTL